MKLGRYIAIINPPISTPNTDMMIERGRALARFSDCQDSALKASRRLCSTGSV